MPNSRRLDLTSDEIEYLLWQEDALTDLGIDSGPYENSRIRASARSKLCAAAKNGEPVPTIGDALKLLRSYPTIPLKPGQGIIEAVADYLERELK